MPKKSSSKSKKSKSKRRIKWEVEVSVGKKKYFVRMILVGEIDRSLKLSDSELSKIQESFLSSYGYRRITLDQFKIFEITKA